MKNSRTCLITRRLLTKSGVTAALALSLGIAAHAQTPLVSYTFNDSSNTATTVSSGSDALSDAVLSFYTGYVTANGASNVASNLHGAAGSGVSGAPGDLAFNNSAATNMGSLGTAGSVQSSGIPAALSSPLTAFTITGWFKSNPDPTDFLNDSARLFDAAFPSPTSSPQEIAMLGTNGGQIQFVINGDRCYCNQSYTLKNVWTFFAISYDSTAANANGTTGAATFYIGYRPQDFTTTTPPNNTVSAISIGPANSGGTGGPVTFTTSDKVTPASPGAPVFAGILDIGNSVSAGAGNTRGFAGLMDDVSIYGTALTQAQVELIRQANITPGSSGSIALPGVMSGNLGQPMVFTFTPTGTTATTPGAGVIQQTITPAAADGTFTLAGVVPGTYTLGVKGAKWLQQNAPVNTTSGASTSLNYSLLGGDVNGDNQVSFADFVQLRNAYGSTPASTNWNPLADINCDGQVSFSDFVILRNNYGKAGDTNP